MSKVVANSVVLGQSGTDTNNFLLDTDVAGALRIRRKSDGSGGTLLSLGASGSDSFLSKSYASANQTITSAGSLTLAHGLGTVPLLVTQHLVCQTAEAGYSIGDVLVANTSISSATLEGYGTSIVVDSTNINIRFGSQSTVFMANNKTSGAIATLTNANWRLIVRAWA